MTDLFYQRIISVIKRIPKGRVATYGQVAALAGQLRGARQVARALHASSRKEHLPWHRVINSGGRISLPRGSGFEEQQIRLRKEGIAVSDNGHIELRKYQWKPRARRW